MADILKTIFSSAYSTKRLHTSNLFGSFLLRLILIPPWISNYIHYKVWDQITSPFLSFNGAAIEAWE